ncbi:MAG: HAD-IIIA family hydrolase [Desulfomonilia bacterium]|jgi:3-deoxy-D-manno-octulosonate 8-phosphate phosphatase (KDO 8-P phosphatase)
MNGGMIRMLVLDADGVLTDGRILYTDDGGEIKAFHVRDGHGIKLLIRAGIGVAIITGRISRAVEHRARDLGIEHLVQGAKDKRSALLELSRQVGIEPAEMAYMGDDVVDLPAMALCGLSIAPGDAAEMVRQKADIVTEAHGGKGAVREAVELILGRLGLFEKAMERYVD